MSSIQDQRLKGYTQFNSSGKKHVLPQRIKLLKHSGWHVVQAIMSLKWSGLPGRPRALRNDETLPSYSRREQGRTTWRHWKFLFEAFDPSTVLSQISFWETRYHRHYVAPQKTKVRLFKVIRRLKPIAWTVDWYPYYFTVDWSWKCLQ